MPLPLIVSDPKVMMGNPVIAGTRITVELLLEKLAAGEPAERLSPRRFPYCLIPSPKRLMSDGATV